MTQDEIIEMACNAVAAAAEREACALLCEEIEARLRATYKAARVGLVAKTKEVAT